MRKINGKLEAFEHIKEVVEEVVEAEPTLQEEVAELKAGFAKLQKLIEPLIKYLGG